MRLVHGTDLSQLLKRDGRLQPIRATEFIAQIASALDAAHAAGLVHRDVKPGNVLVGDDDHIYLTDFGITRIEDTHTRITDSGGFIGSVDYMSPEHLRGEPTDARSDVYSLGAVLHAALTGTPPMRRTTIPATIQAHLNEAPAPASLTTGVPAAFDSIIAKAMAKNPADRYRSAGQLADDALNVDPAELIAAELTAVIEREDEPATQVVRDRAATVVAARPPETETRIQPWPEPGSAPQGRPEAVKKRLGSGRRKRLAAGVVLLLALGGTAWAALRPTPRVSGPVTAVEVRGAVNAFARAYSTEDVNAMRRILTVDTERVAADSRQRGRPAVLAEYARQFSQMSIKRYAVRALTVTPGEAGRAEGQFEVTRTGAQPIRGTVTFVVVRRSGRPGIRLLTTGPSAV
jgi:serine/threonine-protein kinase